MVKFFNRASAKKGLPAGSPIYVGDSAPVKTEITFIQYNADRRPISTSLQPKNIQEQIKQLPTAGGWLHITGLQNAEVIHEVCEALEVHSLVIEDILNTEQISKIEFFPDYTLIITREPIMTARIDQVKLEQISFILKGNLLITFQKNHSNLLEQINNYLGHFITKALPLDSAHILYLMLDMIIDEHLAIVEQKGEELEAIEEVIIAGREDIQSKTLYLLKRDMLHLRKNIMGLHNIVDSLTHERATIIPKVPVIYLHDLRDHLLRILDSIDVHRELSKNILEIYMSSVNTKINETMKFLAVFAAIFIPLSFVTSFYGMNFPNFPFLQYEHAYVYVVSMMVGIAVGLLVYFRRKKWI